MAASTSQYVRRHVITVPRVSWGAAFPHLHSLNDGLNSSYTPNMASVDKAYVVDAGGTYHAIESGVARVSSVTATNINVWVGENAAGAPALVAGLTAVLGAAPLSIVLDVTTRFAHSVEIGTTAVGDETINLPPVANMGLPISLSLSSSPVTTLETIFVRTTGNDANDGATAGTALATIQEACTRIMRQSPLRHSVLVDIGPGVFPGNWQLSGVDGLNGANVYFVGNVPDAIATDKTSTSAGAATLTTTRDWMGGDRLRWTGDAAWGGAGVPLADPDIGRTVRIDDGVGGHVMFATVANVGTGAGLATQYVDLISNPVLLGIPPAWLAVGGVIPAGVTLRILDHTTATQVTTVTGNVYIGGVHTTAGSDMQPSAATNKHNLLGHIRFRIGTVALEDADRFAYHGTRFETGIAISNCRDCTSNAVVVPGALVTRYWPAAIWTRLGYSVSSDADAWGGMGFLVVTSFAATRTIGTISGMVTAPVPATTFQLSDTCNLTFVGLSHASVQPITILDNSRGSFSYTRSAGPIVAAGTGKFMVQDFVTFAAAGVATDDNIANAPINYDGGMFSLGTGCDGFVVLGAMTRLEGRNSQGVAAGGGRFAVTVTGSTRLSMIGGSDADFYGDGGWILNQNGAVAYLDGTRTFAPKIATDATADIRVEMGSVLRSRGDWAHALVDATPGVLVNVQSASKWIHGNPAALAAGEGVYTIGDGVGGGIDCGAGAAILALGGSYIQIGKPRVFNTNAGVGSRALVLQQASHARVGSGNGVNDAYLESNSGGNEVTYGDIGAGQPNPITVAFASDIAGAGNPQGCTYEIV